MEHSLDEDITVWVEKLHSEVSNKWIVVEMEGVVREFSVSLLGLVLSSIFINNLDSGIENVLLTFLAVGRDC